MGTDDVHKNKRIRHCYPRNEVFHRWIHSGIYVYSKEDRYNVSSFDNYLFNCHLGDVFKKADKSLLTDVWNNYRSNQCIAVINRNKKIILVKNTQSRYYYDILKAIPDDYTVFYTNDTISDHTILDKDDLEEVLLGQIRYYITSFVFQNCSMLYHALKEDIKTLHHNIDDIFNKKFIIRHSRKNINYLYNYYDGYRLILDFIKKYKLSQYDWYDKPIGSFINLDYSKRIKVPFPTIKDLIYNRLFTHKEKEYLRQKYVYTKYCYGKSIPFSLVKNFWNEPITIKEYNIILKSNDIPLEQELPKHFSNIKEALVYVQNKIDVNNRTLALKYQTINETNRNEALAKLEKLCTNSSILEKWRKNERGKTESVEYYEYYKNRYGIYTKVLRSVTKYPELFNNIQLKLDYNNTEIKTSKGARITLEEGIAAFRGLIHIIKANSNIIEDKIIRLADKHIKYGIYPLVSVSYKIKESDTGVKYDYKDWCITIGCHHIWFEEVKEFIKYYKLEKEFGYEQTD